MKSRIILYVFTLTLLPCVAGALHAAADLSVAPQAMSHTQEIRSGSEEFTIDVGGRTPPVNTGITIEGPAENARLTIEGGLDFMPGHRPLTIRVDPSGLRPAVGRIANDKIHRPADLPVFQRFHILAEDGDLILHGVFRRVFFSQYGQVFLHLNPVNVNIVITIGQYERHNAAAGSQVENPVARTRPGVTGQ